MAIIHVAIGAAVGFISLPVVLPAVGFTSSGVAAGSLAAAVQSSVFGGATAAVPFGMAQSAGVVGTTLGAKGTFS